MGARCIFKEGLPFFKKRSKKLLPIEAALFQAAHLMIKSFLVLFFKKELLTYFP